MQRTNITGKKRKHSEISHSQESSSKASNLSRDYIKRIASELYLYAFPDCKSADRYNQNSVGKATTFKIIQIDRFCIPMAANLRAKTAKGILDADQRANKNHFIKKITGILPPKISQSEIDTILQHSTAETSSADANRIANLLNLAECAPEQKSKPDSHVQIHQQLAAAQAASVSAAVPIHAPVLAQAASQVAMTALVLAPAQLGAPVQQSIIPAQLAAPVAQPVDPDFFASDPSMKPIKIQPFLHPEAGQAFFTFPLLPGLEHIDPHIFAEDGRLYLRDMR